MKKLTKESFHNFWQRNFKKRGFYITPKNKNMPFEVSGKELTKEVKAYLEENEEDWVILTAANPVTFKIGSRIYKARPRYAVGFMRFTVPVAIFCSEV